MEALTPATLWELREKAEMHKKERDRLQSEADALVEEKRTLSTKASRLESEAKHAEKLAADDAISAREAALLKDQWQAKLDLMMSRGGLGDINGTKYQIKHHAREQERLERSVKAAEREIVSKRAKAGELRRRANDTGKTINALRKRTQSEHDAYISVMRRIQHILEREEDQMQ